MLGEQLKILSELKLDFDLEAVGFEVPEIDLLIDGLGAIPDVDPNDDVPAMAESAVNVAGDLWQLGNHRVLCGNSLVTASYKRPTQMSDCKSHSASSSGLKKWKSSRERGVVGKADD